MRVILFLLLVFSLTSCDINKCPLPDNKNYKFGDIVEVDGEFYKGIGTVVRLDSYHSYPKYCPKGRIIVKLKVRSGFHIIEETITISTEYVKKIR